MRTIPDIDDLFLPLEEAIRYQLLPALTGRSSFSDAERELLALPVRHGGLGIPQPSRSAGRQFRACSEVAAPLVNLIRTHNPSYPKQVQLEQRQVKAQHRSHNRSDSATEADTLKATLPKAQQLSMEQASEKGASSWLTTIPLSKYGNTSTSRPSGMPCASGSAGHPGDSPHTVRVVSPSLSVTRSAAQRVPCPPSATMLSGT